MKKFSSEAQRVRERKVQIGLKVEKTVIISIIFRVEISHLDLLADQI